MGARNFFGSPEASRKTPSLKGVAGTARDCPSSRLVDWTLVCSQGFPHRQPAPQRWSPYHGSGVCTKPVGGPWVVSAPPIRLLAGWLRWAVERQTHGIPAIGDDVRLRGAAPGSPSKHGGNMVRGSALWRWWDYLRSRRIVLASISCQGVLSGLQMPSTWVVGVAWPLSHKNRPTRGVLEQ